MKLLIFLLLIVQQTFLLQRKIDDIMHDALLDKTFPGGVVIVGDAEKVHLSEVYGFHTYDPGSRRVAKETLFDLASLTKVVGTSMMTMLLYEEDRLRLDDLVSHYIPTFIEGDKKDVTIQDLLTHVSGLRPDEQVENIEMRDDESNAQAVLRRIINLPLQCKPRTKVIYSCLNFYLLAHINELVADEMQHEFLKRKIFEPLHMDAHYHLTEEQKKICAPTLPDLQGMVHDPLARFYGLDDGAPGNAGIFASGAALIPFCTMLLNHGIYNGIQIFEKETIDKIKKCYTGNLNKRRALGFDIFDWYPYTSAHMCDENPETYIIGHTGYTGTMVWIDLLKRRYLIFLTNRVYPYEKSQVNPVRRQIIKLLLKGTLE